MVKTDPTKVKYGRDAEVKGTGGESISRTRTQEILNRPQILGAVKLRLSSTIGVGFG